MFIKFYDKEGMQIGEAVKVWDGIFRDIPKGAKSWHFCNNGEGA